jgi:hypothetical protein
MATIIVNGATPNPNESASTVKVEAAYSSARSTEETKLSTDKAETLKDKIRFRAGDKGRPLQHLVNSEAKIAAEVANVAKTGGSVSNVLGAAGEAAAIVAITTAAGAPAAFDAYKNHPELPESTRQAGAAGAGLAEGGACVTAVATSMKLPIPNPLIKTVVAGAACVGAAAISSYSGATDAAQNQGAIIGDKSSGAYDKTMADPMGAAIPSNITIDAALKNPAFKEAVKDYLANKPVTVFLDVDGNGTDERHVVKPKEIGLSLSDYVQADISNMAIRKDFPVKTLDDAALMAQKPAVVVANVELVAKKLGL